MTKCIYKHECSRNLKLRQVTRQLPECQDLSNLDSLLAQELHTSHL